MEIKTEIRDVRVSYDGLGEIFRYLSKPENRESKVTRAEYHPVEGKNKGDYFSVDVSIPRHMDSGYADRIINDIVMGIGKNDPELARVLNTPIEEIGLPVRPYQCFVRAGIKTVGGIVSCTEEELLNLRSFGKVSLEDVNRALKGFGLKVGMEPGSIGSETVENQ